MACVIIVRVFHIAEETMALGIIAAGLFLLFMVWALVTAPSGPKKVPINGQPYILASALITSFEIHDFLAQNIIKNPNKNEYKAVVRWTFFLGAVIYMFCSLSSFGIFDFNSAVLNRKGYTKNPQTVNQYFLRGGWQVAILEYVYLIITTSIFPNYLIVSM